MNAPGSPSSPLQMTYLVSPVWWLATRHCLPVGKPAPPRPRRPERSIREIISSLDSGSGQATDGSAECCPATAAVEGFLRINLEPGWMDGASWSPSAWGGEG